MREKKVDERRGVHATLMDRLVSYFDPVAGARRLHARAVIGAMSGSHTGASKSRRSLAAWRPGGGSANAATLPDLPTLRERSSDLRRNAPLACGALNTVVTKVIGTGLSLKSRVDRAVLRMDEAAAEAWQDKTETEFRMWAEQAYHCDLTGTSNFYTLQGIAEMSCLERGDVFATLPVKRRPGCPYGLKINLIEADRCCNPNSAADTERLIAGIEYDADGLPLRYHFQRSHPGDLRVARREWDAVQAFGDRTQRRNVLHYYDVQRIGLGRGIPYLAPVIEPLKQLERYTEAEIMAAVVSGLFTVFIKTEAGEGPSPLESAVSGHTSTTGNANAKADDWNGELGSGIAVDLKPGEDIEAPNPGRPNQAFDPFVQAILRQIGVALELPFEVLIKHFTASYTAARAALLEAWLFIRKRRDRAATYFCDPIYHAWLDEAVALGRISAPGYFTDPLIRFAYRGAEWIGDGMGVLDPQREAAAAQARIDMEISTREKESLAYDGGDWRHNHAQRAKEERMRRESGLLPAPNAPAQNAAAPNVPGNTPPAQAPNDDETDDDTET